MYSHKTLVFIALAASTATPALSAPVLEGQKQARAAFSGRDLANHNFLDDFKTLGEFVNTTGLSGRDLASFLDGVKGDFKTFGELVKNKTGLRREPSPLSLPDLSGIGKTVLGAGASLAAADASLAAADAIKGFFDSNSTSRRDLNEALQLLSRQLDELD
ncbi:hypothetical protein EDB85DRAFT_1892212 [Lactarius pseudohatsudake]|nr:hypothetical protein EDB85DRAFT_1892212 [Lactarius pseudohatsudake]